MIYKTFGKTGFKVSAIGMGTYYDPAWIAASLFGIRKNSKMHIEAIKAGLDTGINFIDTAEIYHTEPLVAEAVKGIEREKLFIATKVFVNHLNADKVIKSCNRSLRNLNMKYIDLYQIHFPSSRIPLSETLSAMEQLVDQGKIRHIGISNFDLIRTEEAMGAMKKYEIVSTQMPYNINNRTIETELKPFCDKNNIAIMAYYPLAHGKIAGNRQGVPDTVKKVAEKHKSPLTHIAIQWLLSRGENVYPIPRASDPVHVRENAEFDKLTLDEEDLKQLNQN